MCTVLAGLAGCAEDIDLASDWDDQSGQDVSTTFVWTRAEDVETRKAFLRNFGVGYSYNAVRGEYCNWRDIRCQVINRMELWRQANAGIVLWKTQELDNAVIHTKTSYSQRDYVATMDLSTKESIDLGLYSGTKRTRQYVLEEGLQDQFYYSTEERIEKGEQYILTSLIMEQVTEDDNEALLTVSFQDAVEHLAYADEKDIAVIDSFINVWGTHVITRAILGATLRLDLKNYMWRYTDQVAEQQFTTRQIMEAYNKRKESRKEEDIYTMIEHSSLNIEAQGGDQSVLGNLIGEAHYDGTRDFSMSDVEKWRLSVNFDPSDEESSNVEMVSMEVVPIWDFIKYEHVAKRVKAVVLQDAALQQELLGDRNFFDTRFPIRYPQLRCRYHNSSNSWNSLTRMDSNDEPMVVNIVSGGRYVATVCRETLDGRPMWVCYPIYEGKVKLACGMGVTDDNRVYQVRWLNGKVQLLRQMDLDKAAAGGQFYINGGAVTFEAFEGMNYAESHAMPYMEVDGGVQPDGGFSIPACYPALKQGADFFLWLPSGSATPVGWTSTGVTNGGKKQYKRNAEYIYIYNPTELDYDE